MEKEIITIVIRILLTTVLVGVIGYERESKEKPAGLRTHLMIGVGACGLMLMTIYGFQPYLNQDGEQIDLSRIPSYVISGLGFLGAGAIIKNRNNVMGLTTASSIWISAIIGLIVGIGMYILAIVITSVIMIILYVLYKIERRM